MMRDLAEMEGGRIKKGPGPGKLRVGKPESTAEKTDGQGLEIEIGLRLAGAASSPSRSSQALETPCWEEPPNSPGRIYVDVSIRTSYLPCQM